MGSAAATKPAVAPFVSVDGSGEEEALVVGVAAGVVVAGRDWSTSVPSSDAASPVSTAQSAGFSVDKI